MKSRPTSFYVYLLARVVAGAASAATIGLLVAYLSHADFGVWGYFRVVGAALVPIVSLSLPAAMMRMYFDHDPGAQRRSLINTVFLLSTISLAVLALAGLALFALVGDAPLALYIATVAGGAVMVGFFNTLARTRDDVWVFFVNRVVETLGFMLLVWLAVGVAAEPAHFVSRERLLFLVIAYASCVGSITIGNVLFYRACGLLRSNTERLSRERIGALVRFSVPLSVSYFLGWMLSSSDAYVLAQLSSESELANYVFATAIASFVALITQAALTDWPRFFFAQMKNEGPASRDTIARRARWFLWLHVAVLVVLRLVVRPAYALFGADEYLDGLDYVRFLALGNFFLLAGNLYAIGIHHAKRTSWSMLLWAVPGVINVVLNLLLIPTWGAYAATLTTVVSFAVFALLGRKLGARYYAFRDTRHALAATAAACAVSLVPLPFLA